MENPHDSPWIDVTRPIFHGMSHWPGDPEVAIERLEDMDKGQACNVTGLAFGAHCGTHIDAPIHYIPNGISAELAPLATMMGRVRIVEIDDPVCVRLADLEPLGISSGERILFRTRNRHIPWEGPFNAQFVYISAAAARHLAQCGVALVGIDGMSVGGFYQDMVETHVVLLGAGIWIIENLDLREISPGPYEMICLPMKIVGADGAPARVLLRPLTDSD